MLKLKQFAKTILRPRPWGLKTCGKHCYFAYPYKLTGREYMIFGNRVSVGRHSWISAIDEYAGKRHSPKISIGDDCHIGQYSCIIAVSNVSIEDGCVLSEYVYITDSAHGIDPEAGLIMKQPLLHKGDVIIGSYSFLGYRVCVMPGVSLGRHCVVGANSVVTHSFPDFSMIAGAPAQLIKTYSVKDKCWIRVQANDKQ